MAELKVTLTFRDGVSDAIAADVLREIAAYGQQAPTLTIESDDAARVQRVKALIGQGVRFVDPEPAPEPEPEV